MPTTEDPVVSSRITEQELAVAHEMLGHMGDRRHLWAVVTGTHQYGFTSPDSDIDVRAVFAAPTRTLLGLGYEVKQHVEYDGIVSGREADCLGFELGRFLELVSKHAGNLIEELYSPLVLVDGGRLADFRRVMSRCLTRGLSRHYVGFFEACMKKLRKREPPEVKTALYACRIALTGITLLREGVVEAHLPTLNETFGLDYVDAWIALKKTEHEPVPEGQLDPMMRQLSDLRRRLHRAASKSDLPENPEGLEALNDLLIEVRLANLELAREPS